jgi:hypothetical protein
VCVYVCVRVCACVSELCVFTFTQGCCSDGLGDVVWIIGKVLRDCTYDCTCPRTSIQACVCARACVSTFRQDNTVIIHHNNSCLQTMVCMEVSREATGSVLPTHELAKGVFLVLDDAPLLAVECDDPRCMGQQVRPQLILVLWVSWRIQHYIKRVHELVVRKACVEVRHKPAQELVAGALQPRCILPPPPCDAETRPSFFVLQACLLDEIGDAAYKVMKLCVGGYVYAHV